MLNNGNSLGLPTFFFFFKGEKEMGKMQHGF